jgi:RimJ/RimL family protein N-acetyltransferase
MPQPVARPFNGQDDLFRLVNATRFNLAARWPRPAYWHAGDLVWQLYAFTEAGRLKDVRLWMDGRELAAFAIFEAPLRVQFDTAPGREDAEKLVREVLNWAAARRRSAAARSMAMPLAYSMLGDDTLVTSVIESDRERSETLERLGWSEADRGDIYYSRDLADMGEPPRLPAGMRLRHATEADVAERAHLHADAWSVWGPSSMTTERHAMLRRAPLYREDLDVVVEDPAGHLVSYAVCWFDEMNGVATFEPVGTRPAFTGMGLSRAVLHEAMCRARDLGAHTATVSTATVNTAARHVYPSAGFKEVDRARFYTLRVL